MTVPRSGSPSSLAYVRAPFGFDLAGRQGFDGSAHHLFPIYPMARFGWVLAGDLFYWEKLETTGIYAKL